MRIGHLGPKELAQQLCQEPNKKSYGYWNYQAQHYIEHGWLQSRQVWTSVLSELRNEF